MVTVHRDNCPTQCRLALRPMFEDRKRLFVDLLAWQVPVISGAYEIDQFDGPACIYLVESDAEDTHLGSLRLLPTERPHILDTLFPGLCDDLVPRGPTVWEITRLCLPPRLGAERRLAVRNCLISAMVDHALASGIEALTGVVEMNFLNQILDMGWTCQPLGAPARSDGRLLAAFRIDLDVDTPASLYAAGIYRAGTLAAPCAQAA
jgi:N-acyl-L-homoserine lactone synthetase